MHPNDLLLYAITDCDRLQGEALITQTELLLQNGITMLQFRDKNRSRQDAYHDAKALRELCRRYRVPFIVNDDVDLAREVDADGVHLGQSDAGCRIAKIKLGRDKLVGISAHNLEEAKKALADGADYLGCGAVFTSSSKDADLLPKDMLQAISGLSTIPVVAIGGINSDNATALANTGIAGIAVISALYGATDPATATKNLLAIARKLTGAPEPVRINGALITNTDGILCNTLAAWEKLAGDYLNSVGIEAGPDLNNIIKDKTMPESAAYIKHNYSVPDGITQILADWEYDLRAFYNNEASLNDGGKALIEEMTARNLPLVIATEAPRDLAYQLIDHIGLSDHVKAVVSGVDDRFSRTDADFYRRAADASGAADEGIWVIEDSLAGLRSARRAGLHAAAIRTDRVDDHLWEELKKEGEAAFVNLDELVIWLRQSQV